MGKEMLAELIRFVSAASLTMWQGARAQVVLNGNEDFIWAALMVLMTGFCLVLSRRMFLRAKAIEDTRDENGNYWKSSDKQDSEDNFGGGWALAVVGWVLFLVSVALAIAGWKRMLNTDWYAIDLLLSAARSVVR
jgi:hypothetical protein